MRASLAGYKVPKQVVFVDEVVRSPSGKADYRWAAEVAVSASDLTELALARRREPATLPHRPVGSSPTRPACRKPSILCWRVAEVLEDRVVVAAEGRRRRSAASGPPAKSEMAASGSHGLR